MEKMVWYDGKALMFWWQRFYVMMEKIL